MPPKARVKTLRRNYRGDASTRIVLKSTKRKARANTGQKIPPGIISRFRFLSMKMAFQVDMPVTTAGTITFTNLNIGSVYDLSGSTGTRQPYGTAIMFQLYKYATVMSAKIKLTAMAPYSDTSPITVMMQIQNTSAQSANIDELADFYESPNRVTRVKMFGNYISKNLDTNNYITGFYSAKKYYGYNSNIDTDPDYASTGSGNPTTAPHLGVYAVTPYGATSSSAAISFVCQVSQIVKWWGPLDIDND